MRLKAMILSRWPLLRRFSIPRPAAQSENPFATHLPVLVAIARLTRITSVLEFGCGDYSTRTFLDPSTFPDVRSLHAVENNRAWLDRTRERVGDDPRIQWTYQDAPIHRIVSAMSHHSYSLIFIDDSATVEDRAKTIAAVAGRYDGKSVVVLHDFELPEYQQAARAFPRACLLDALLPATGVVCSEDVVKRDVLTRVNTLIRRNRARIKPDDVTGWADLFDRRLRKKW
jgi:hypothetical protein